MRRGYHPFNALFGATLYALGQSILCDLVYLGGSYPRVLGAAFIPVAFVFLEDLLENKDRILNFALLVLVLAVAFLSHPLTGLMIMLMLGVYGTLKVVLDQKVRGKEYFLGILSFVVTVLLCATWFVPFFFEKTGWTALPSIGQTVNTISSIYFRSRYDYLIFLLIPVFIFLKRPKKPSDIALFLTAIFAFLFAMGSAGYVYYLFSFLSIYPFLGGFFVVFALSFLVATTVDFGKLRWWGKILAVLLFAGVLAYQGNMGRIQTNAFTRGSLTAFGFPQTKAVLNKAKSIYQGGRLMMMRYPFPDQMNWWAPVYGFPMVEGWYYSTTPQGKQIAWMYDAAHYGYPEYVVRRLKQLNVRVFLKNHYFDNNPAHKEFAAVLDQLEKDGFKQIDSEFGGEAGSIYYGLYFKNQPSNYFQPVQETRLIIGKDASVANTLIPGSIQGDSIYIDDYESKLLRHFSTIVLTGFSYHNKRLAEETIRGYLRDGGNVVLDLNRMDGSRLVDLPSFLGVETQREITRSDIKIETAPNGLRLPTTLKMPEELSYVGVVTARETERVPLKEFRYVEYLNLDKQLAWRENEEDGVQAIMGYKEIEGKNVWFMGPNFFYYTFLTHNSSFLELLDWVVKNGEDQSKAILPKSEQAKISVVNDDLENKKIKYASESDFPLLVSYTFSHRWKAFIDGKQTKIYNFESMMLLDLSAGEHEVEMVYEATNVGLASTSISYAVLIGMLYLLGLGVFKKYKK